MSSPSAPPIRVTVRFFAAARDLAACESTVRQLLAGSTVSDLRGDLAAAFPALAGLLSHSLLAVNQEYAANDAPLGDGAEAAVIPPVSGG